MSDEKDIQEFKRLIENDKSFIGSEFLRSFSKAVFGIPSNNEVKKNLSFVLKSYKSFFLNVFDLEKKNKIKICNLNSTEKNILDCLITTVDTRIKSYDGTFNLDKFKQHLNTTNIPENDNNRYIIDQHTKQYEIGNEDLSILENQLSCRKSSLNSVIQRNILSDFLDHGHESCANLEEYKERFNTLLMSCVKDTSNSFIDRNNFSILSDKDALDIITKKKFKKKISTRYKVFDMILRGGFENGRVYVLGGISGGGKSLVMVNFAYMASKTLALQNNTDRKWAVLYLTLENSCSETEDRIASLSTGYTSNKMDDIAFLEDKSEFKKFENMWNEQIKNNKKCDIIIQWAAPQSINCVDIASLISDISRSMDIDIKICFVDYADKLKSTSGSSDNEWITLGMVFDEMKAAAVTLDIPFVTVTQVNRNAYKENFAMTGESISGSHRKKENSDVLLMFDFQAREQVIIDEDNGFSLEDYEKRQDTGGNFTPIWGFVDKNRDGPTGMKYKCYIDYSTYRFVDNINRVVEAFDLKNFDMEEFTVINDLNNNNNKKFEKKDPANNNISNGSNVPIASNNNGSVSNQIASSLTW
jgi:replicative DNA helicase